MKVPQIEPFDVLEKRAADEDATLHGAWWIATQATVHLLTTMSRRDGYTGQGLPDSLREMLKRLDEELESGPRPMPRDTVFRAMELCEEALQSILLEPRDRLVREHEMVPIHAAGEVDQKTMQWMGRLPGRTAREKLAGRKKIKAPRRRFSVDTQENRVVRRVLEWLEERVEARDRYYEAYDDEDSRVVERLRRMRRLCGVQLRNSELDDVEPAVVMRQNNVMIDDRRYARVWRAAKLLQKRKELANSHWKKMPRRAREMLFWGLVARLVHHHGARFWDRPGVIYFEADDEEAARSWSVHQGGRAGGGGSSNCVELWFPPREEGGEEWFQGKVKLVDGNYGFIRRDDGNGDVYFNHRSMAHGERFGDVEKGMDVRFELGTPPSKGKSPPARELRIFRPEDAVDAGLILRITQDDETLSVQLGELSGSGKLAPAFTGSPVRYDIAFDPSSELVSSRGMPCSIPIDLMGNQIDRGRPVDPQGIRELIDMLEHQVLSDVPIMPSSTVSTESNSGGEDVEEQIQAGGAVGVDFGGSRPLVAGRGDQMQRAGGYAVGFELDGAPFWEVETPNRPLRTPADDDKTASISSIFEMGSAGDMNGSSVGLRKIVGELGTRAALDDAEVIGYAVPELADEQGKRRLKAWMDGEFRPRQVIPIWRSVAAATGWQLNQDGELADGELILVVDAEAPQLTLTPLVCRHDDELAKELPKTKGVYWEKRPSLAPDDADELLTAKRLLTNYAERLLKKCCGHCDMHLVEYLVASGRIQELVDHGQLELPLHDERGRWLRLIHDPGLWETCGERWLDLLEDRLNQVFESNDLDGLIDDHSLHSLLLVGRPFQDAGSLLSALPGLDLQDKGEDGRERGQIKFVNGEKNFGFISRFGDKEDVFLHRGSLKDPDRFGDLSSGMHVSFVAKPGNKGPRAEALDTGMPSQVVETPALAQGLVDLASRAHRELTTWAEWMPKLGIEVIQDGHFGFVQLLTDETVKISHTGRRQTVEPSSTLELPAGRDEVLLPMLAGEDGREIIGLQGRLAGASFPLSESVQVNLEFGFVPGVDGDWSIKVADAPGEKGSVGELSARWVGHGRGTDDSSPGPVTPEFGEPKNGDSLLSTKEAAQYLDGIEANRGDEKTRKEKCWEIEKMLGAGKADRARIVEKTLDCIRSFRSFDGFNPALLNAAVSGLGGALWRNSQLVNQLPEVDDEAVELLLGVSDRGLRNIAARLPLLADQIRDDKGAKSTKLKKYASPYRNICQVLMALLRLRGAGDFKALQPNNRRIRRMARYIRRIDARLAEFEDFEIDKPWLTPLLKANAKVAPRPRHLRRMSQLGYQTHYFLLGGELGLAKVVDRL